MSIPVLFIDTSADYQKSITTIQNCDVFAIDLEFDKNFYRYGFNLCLVQIFTGKTCYLIDPLSSEIDINLLFPLLENDRIQKVCFSFDEDLRLLHSLGCIPKNLYDLGIVSRLLNYPASSLTNLLDEVLQVDTGNSSQQSNWYKRPLTQNQIHYAANDVLHLLKLKQAFQNEANKNGVKKWIEEENQSLDHLDYRDIDHNEVIKDKDMNGFTEHQWFLFKKLLYWRDDKGREFNKPPFQIMPKSFLSEIVKDSRKLMDWQNSKSIYRKLKTEAVKNELIHLLQEANEEARSQNLSETKPAKNHLSKEEYRQLINQKKEVNKVKRTFFKPVKDRIEENHGSEIASFLLSNRIIDELINGTNGKLSDYKKELIIETAEELNLQYEDVKKYFK